MSFVATLTGSFSTPADDNPTVVMMEAAYAALDLNARYVNCDVGPAGLGDAVRGARAMGWVGFNCSLPHKVTVIEHLDGLAESARIIGAVNCVVARDGRLIGENTDGVGFVDSLGAVRDPAGARVVLLGAGGAARAIAVELGLAGAAAITIVNRDASRGQELADLVSSATAAAGSFVPWEGEFRVPDGVDVLVQATSVGLAPDVDAMVPLALDSITRGMLVADVIPNPPQTRLLREAQARGATTLDGLGMLVSQGAAAVRHWTGREPDLDVMRAALADVFTR